MVLRTPRRIRGISRLPDVRKKPDPRDLPSFKEYVESLSDIAGLFNMTIDRTWAVDIICNTPEVDEALPPFVTTRKSLDAKRALATDYGMPLDVFVRDHNPRQDQIISGMLRELTAAIAYSQYAGIVNDKAVLVVGKPTKLNTKTLDRICKRYVQYNVFAITNALRGVRTFAPSVPNVLMIEYLNGYREKYGVFPATVEEEK